MKKSTLIIISLAMFWVDFVQSQKLSGGKTNIVNCSSVQIKLSRRLKEYELIPRRNTTTHSEQVQVCSKGQHCCTSDIEEKLLSVAKHDFNATLSLKFSSMSQMFASRTVKFDDFFTNLLDSSKKSLNAMLVKTYGILYQQNSHIFIDLLNSLRAFYKGEDVSLDEALKQFFSVLLQRMFELYNSQHTFDDKYLTCIAGHMEDVKPFGNIPKELSTQVKRSFVAARTFVLGLSVGRDVIQGISKMSMTSTCSRSVTNMLYCSDCHDLKTESVRPCHMYCQAVVRGCFSRHVVIRSPWEEYIGGLLKLAEQLEGPYNIENVVDPIEIKISDAIMNFQENVIPVSEKLFAFCGEPKFEHDRKKRSIDRPHFSRSRRNQKSSNPIGRPMNQSSARHATERPSLDMMVRDIRRQIETAKNFWHEIIDEVCKVVDATPENKDTFCWNGQRHGRFTHEIAPIQHSTEFNLTDQQSSSIDTQVQQLRLVTSRLRSAYHGQDIDWMDDVEVSDGSGGFHDADNIDSQLSGSGWKSWDEEEDDDDDNDDDHYYDEKIGAEDLSHSKLVHSTSSPHKVAVYATASITNNRPAADTRPTHAAMTIASCHFILFVILISQLISYDYSVYF